MGKKYIIELLDDCKSEFKGIMVFGLTQEKQISVELIPEESLRPYTEPDLEQIRKEAYEDGYKTAKVQCNIQAEKDLREVGERHYQKGLSDAWEAARKVVALSTVDRRKVFGSEYMYSILEKHTASEAIEKIRQYEQKQEEQIQVGDEVERILNGEVDSKAVFLEDNEGYYHCLFWTGCCFTTLSYPKEQFRKTGRHFDEIATVLEKMKES